MKVNYTKLKPKCPRWEKADGRAGILRITQDGKPVDEGILGASYPLNLYLLTV